eukprot:TRINITY_DN1058_c0_g1_i1.p1 TRINITY_DN1058_c0_g1~~TRINITY_DN1058_c0_g1_i1.p1  ORF type:complete len:275 (-),score=33.98 TRINITY_DN1058_c0_g1_i1:79-903(-)
MTLCRIVQQQQLSTLTRYKDPVQGGVNWGLLPRISKKDISKFFTNGGGLGRLPHVFKSTFSLTSFVIAIPVLVALNPTRKIKFLDEVQFQSKDCTLKHSLAPVNERIYIFIFKIMVLKIIIMIIIFKLIYDHPPHDHHLQDHHLHEHYLHDQHLHDHHLQDHHLHDHLHNHHLHDHIHDHHLQDHRGHVLNGQHPHRYDQHHNDHLCHEKHSHDKHPHSQHRHDKYLHDQHVMISILIFFFSGTIMSFFIDHHHQDNHGHNHRYSKHGHHDSWH